MGTLRRRAFLTWDEAKQWLIAAALLHYPQSVFALSMRAARPEDSALTPHDECAGERVP